jgi:hypothetical protein
LDNEKVVLAGGAQRGKTEKESMLDGEVVWLNFDHYS